MGKLGGFGLLVTGVLLVLLGLVLMSGILQWLLWLLGIVVIIVGAVVGIIGIVKLFTGGGSGGGSYDY